MTMARELVVDHKEEQWARLLGEDRVRWHRLVRTCRRMEINYGRDSVLHDFLAKVEFLREEYGYCSIPLDVRNKTLRVKLRLGQKPRQEELQKTELDTDSDTESTHETDSGSSPRNAQRADTGSLYTCVDCASEHELNENFQCPGCGQDYCHDCVDLEKESNKDSVCNRCLESKLLKCRICRLDNHCDDSTVCPGCSSSYCDGCMAKKERMTESCNNCGGFLCYNCSSSLRATKCARCRPEIVDLVDSVESEESN